MRTATFKHALVGTAMTGAVVLAAGGLASAHIDPDPIAMQAGTTATVAFNVEHGCAGSPTTSMKFQIPPGVTDAVGVPKDGWTATLTGDTLEFKGGPLAPDQSDHFDIGFTSPATPGEIRFPVIQMCEVGELAWIEVPDASGVEPEHPAPTINITENAPTSAELTPAPEEATAGTEAGTSGTAATVDTATVVSATIVPASSDDSSNTGTIVVIVVIVAVVVVGGGVLVARRKNAARKA
ncbi:MAG: DUF1775 domain-containing protein [Ilumatobacteraceae bacterium]